MEFVFVIIIGIFVVVMCLWGIVSPQSLYWKFNAWRYKNPEANEPSDTSYLLTRVSGMVILGVIVIGGLSLWSAADTNARKEESQEQCDEEVLPLLKEIWTGTSDDDTALREFAEEHGLRVTIKTMPDSPGRESQPESRKVVFYRDGAEFIVGVSGAYLYATPALSCS